MRVRLGIVAPHQAKALFVKALEGLDGIHVNWACYSDEDAIEAVVAEVLPVCDALCFAGPLSFERVRSTLPEDLPAAELRADPFDLAMGLLRAGEMGLPLAPLSVDTVSTEMVGEVISELGLSSDDVAVLPFRREDTPEDISAFHQEAKHRLGINYVLPGRHSVFALRHELGVPVIKILPAAATVASTIRELALRAVSARKEDANFAAALFRMSSAGADVRDHADVVKDALGTDPYWKDAWIHKASDVEVLVLGHKKLMEEKTVQWRHNSGLEELNRSVGVRVDVGFGVGESGRGSIRCAEQAAQLAADHPSPCAYLLTENGVVIGPMGAQASKPPQYIFRSDDHVLAALTRRTGLGLSALTRLIAVERQLGGALVSADDLSRHLNLSPASARRIVRALRSQSLVTPVGISQPVRRGRPKNLYRMQIQHALEEQGVQA